MNPVGLPKWNIQVDEFTGSINATGDKIANLKSKACQDSTSFLVEYCCVEALHRDMRSVCSFDLSNFQ